MQSKTFLAINLWVGMGLLFYPESAWAGQVLRTQSMCHPVGRVILSGDPGIPSGTEICEQDHLQVRPGSRVDFLCPGSRRLFKLQGGHHAASELCKSSNRTMRRCGRNSSLLCNPPRGGAGKRPRLTSVYGDTFAQSPATIAWQAVSEAQQYRIFIEGQEQRWSFAQQTTSLDLVKHNVELKLDSTYLITVAAYRNQKSIGKSAVALNFISPRLQAELKHYIDEINRFQIPLFERIRLIDAIYMSEKLLHQTITMLETHQATATQSGEVILLLGDRYWQAGRLDLAKTSFEKAIALGQQFNQPTWIKQAQKGLAVISDVNANGLRE